MAKRKPKALKAPKRKSTTKPRGKRATKRQAQLQAGA
jgi:hypothetical protein